MKNEVPAFIRTRALPPIPQTIYTAAAMDMRTGEWHSVECSTPAAANTPALQMAYVADCATEGGEDHWIKVFAVTIAPGIPPHIADVTDEAVSCLVHTLRKGGEGLRLDCKLGHLPAHFADHDRSITPREIDCDADDPDAEDWSPETLRRELGTY